MRRGNGALFPMFTDITGKEGLIIGGGKTALGKVRHLLAWEPVLKIVAPEFCPELLELAKTESAAAEGQQCTGGSEEQASDTLAKTESAAALGSCRVTLVCREFLSEDIKDDLAFVIAASDQPDVNCLAASICREKRIPVNVVDVPEECTFYFPSLVKRGRLTVGISTGGASPSAAIYVRKEIEKILDDGIGDILDYLAGRRGFVKETIDSESLRKEAFSRLFYRCLECGRPLNCEEEDEILKQVSNDAAERACDNK